MDLSGTKDVQHSRKSHFTVMKEAVLLPKTFSLVRRDAPPKIQRFVPCRQHRPTTVTTALTSKTGIPRHRSGGDLTEGVQTPWVCKVYMSLTYLKVNSLSDGNAGLYY